MVESVRWPRWSSSDAGTRRRRRKERRTVQPNSVQNPELPRQAGFGSAASADMITEGRLISEVDGELVTSSELADSRPQAAAVRHACAYGQFARQSEPTSLWRWAGPHRGALSWTTRRVATRCATRARERSAASSVHGPSRLHEFRGSDAPSRDERARALAARHAPQSTRSRKTYVAAGAADLRTRVPSAVTTGVPARRRLDPSSSPRDHRPQSDHTMVKVVRQNTQPYRATTNIGFRSQAPVRHQTFLNQPVKTVKPGSAARHLTKCPFAVQRGGWSADSKSHLYRRPRRRQVVHGPIKGAGQVFGYLRRLLLRDVSCLAAVKCLKRGHDRLKQMG